MSDGSAVRRRSGDLLPYGPQALLQASPRTDKATESSSGTRLPRAYSTNACKQQIEAPEFAMPEEPAPPVSNHPLLARAAPQPGARSALPQTVSGSRPGYGSATAQLLSRREDEDQEENDDSGKPDSESFSAGDAADDSGKPDSESFSEGDGMADQTVDAADTALPCRMRAQPLCPRRPAPTRATACSPASTRFAATLCASTPISPAAPSAASFAANGMVKQWP